MKSKIKDIFKSVLCVFSILSVFILMTEFDAHRPSPPQFVGSFVEPFAEKGVHIQAKAYNSKESQLYLSRNLHRKGVQPVQVTIQNNSGQIYILSSYGVDFPHHHAGKMALSFSVEHLPRSLALKVGAFFFWPLLIPSVLDSAITTKYHLQMRSDFYAKSLKEEGEVIPAYATVHRILFVPHEEFQEEFILYMQRGGTSHTLPFPVKINS